jgi:phage recombination protein Bet
MTELVKATNNSKQQAPAINIWTRERIDLLKLNICKGATDGELKHCIDLSTRLQLDPFARQIFFIKRWDATTKKEVWTPLVSIDGLRLIAQRSRKYAGQVGPFYSKGEHKTNPQTNIEQMIWYDAWPFKEPPMFAKVGVIHSDFTKPQWETAKYDSYVQKTKEGVATSMWLKMPEILLAKCAESLALRKAFPNELSGVYTIDEMGQSTNVIQAKPVSRMERIEKMLLAFSDLYEKQTGQPGNGIRYLIEDRFGEKKAENFDDKDLSICEMLYRDLVKGVKTWETIMQDKIITTSIEMAEATTEQLDAIFTGTVEDKDLNHM